jgi:hypothetical protein
MKSFALSKMFDGATSEENYNKILCNALELVENVFCCVVCMF